MNRILLSIFSLLIGLVGPLAAQEADAPLDRSNQELPNSNFAKLVIPKANFERSILQFSDFSDAKVPGGNFQRTVCTGVNFARADLAGANFTGSKMQQAGFGDANLAGAILDDTDLKLVTMQKANLKGASLRNAKGIGDLTKADFTDADLRGCDLSLAADYGPKSAIYLRAKYDLFTKFPAGVDPVRAGAVLVKGEGGLAKNPETELGTPLRWFQGVIYYTGGATKEDAQKLGDLLEKEKSFGEAKERLQLTKNGKVFQVRKDIGVKDPKSLEDSDLDQFREFVEWLAKNIYTPSTVELHLCDRDFKNGLVLRSAAADFGAEEKPAVAVNPKPMPEPRPGIRPQPNPAVTPDPGPAVNPQRPLVAKSKFGAELRYDDARLYYTEGITPEEAKRVGDFLAKELGFGSSPQFMQLSKGTGKIELRMAVRKETLAEEQTLGDAQEFANLLARRVFPMSPVELHLCDGQFKTLKVVQPK